MISKGEVGTPELAPEVVTSIGDAQTTADSAAAAAGTAQSTADGKNRIFYVTTAPTNPQSGYALVSGDLWFDTDDSYKLYRWTGSAWTQAVVSGANITAGTIDASVVTVSNLDAGRITVGIISGIEGRFTSGNVGGWQIDPNGLMSPNGNIYLYNDDTTATITCGTGVGNQINISDTGSLNAEYTQSSGGYVNYINVNNPDNAWGITLTSTEGTSRTKIGYSGIAVDDTVGSDFSLLDSNSLGVYSPTANITVSGGSAVPLDLQLNYAVNRQFITFYSKTAAAIVGRIRFNGTSAVEYFTTSDSRLKENVVDITGAVEIIKSIRPVEYNFIGDDDTGKFHGFIAQDLYEVYKYPVGVGGDDPKKDPWGIEYGRLTPILVAGIQDLAAKIEQLEAEIFALKNI